MKFLRYLVKTSKIKKTLEFIKLSVSLPTLYTLSLSILYAKVKYIQQNSLA